METKSRISNQKSRRQFLGEIGLVSSSFLTQQKVRMWNRVAPAMNASHAEVQKGLQHEKDFIKIRKPKSLSGDRLDVERVLIAKEGEYKPCVAKVSGEELLLVNYVGNDTAFPTHQYRSRDDGRSWVGPENVNFGGAEEPYFTSLKGGTLIATSESEGRICCYRSDDGGRTWVKRIQPDDFADKLAATGGSNNSRNVLQLQDGSLLIIVDIPRVKGKIKKLGNEYVARSSDGGRSWREVYPLRVEGLPKAYVRAVFDESYLWQARSGKLFAVARIDHQRWPLAGRTLSNLEIASVACGLLHFGIPPIRKITDSSFDHLDRMKVFSSNDLGRTWQPGPDLGDYGYMYPSMLRLQDGRLLLTFTVRSIDPPLGVRAVLGSETEDGFEFDFANDMIMIDTKTPIGRCSGGGFGPTIQLDDGALLTSYSYWPPADIRKADDWTLPNPSQCEVARWRLPT